MPVALRAEQGQRQRALGDGQDAVAGPMQQRENGGGRSPQQHQHRGTQGMHERRDAGRMQGMQAAQQPELQQPPGHLGRPHQGAGQQHGGRRGAGHVQQTRQVSGHGGADEPGHREHPTQQRGGEDGRRGGLRHRGRHGARAWRDGCVGPRQPGIERQADDQVQAGPGPAGTAPAQRMLQRRRQRPADGAGKAGDEGDAGDGTARLMAVEPHQRGERGFVEPAAHRHTHDQPGREQADRPAGQGHQRQAEGKQRAGGHQHRPTAPAVDAPAGVRPHDGRHDQGRREGGEDGGLAHAQLRRHRPRQHGGQVVGRGPGQRLGAAQGGDDAQPGPVHAQPQQRVAGAAGAQLLGPQPRLGASTAATAAA